MIVLERLLLLHNQDEKNMLKRLGLNDPLTASLYYTGTALLIWIALWFDVSLTFGEAMAMIGPEAPEALASKNLTPPLMCLFVVFFGLCYINATAQTPEEDQQQGKLAVVFNHVVGIATLIMVILITVTNVKDIIYYSISITFGLPTGYHFFKMLTLEDRVLRRNSLIMLAMLVLLAVLYIYGIRQLFMEYSARTLIMDMAMYVLGIGLSLGVMLYLDGMEEMEEAPKEEIVASES